MKSDKYYIFHTSILRSLEQFTTIWSSHYNHGINYDCDKKSQKFCFNFDWSKYVDENLKHKIEFSIKSNGSLAENKIKN